MDRNERLQRYFDDELTAEERARFESELTTEDRERLAALGEMRVVTRGLTRTDVDAPRLWSAIEGQLAITQTATIPRNKSAAPRRSSWSARWAASAGVLAAAAALMVMMRTGGPPTVAATTNDCDIESLEVEGGSATVLQLADAHDNTTTIIWTEED